MEKVKEQIVNHEKFIETVVAYKIARICKKIYDENIDKMVRNADMIVEETECKAHEVFSILIDYAVKK